MGIHLNTRERTVLSILLHAEKPITASEIIKIDGNNMNMNIVQPAIRKLIKENLIEVDEVILEKNVFSRTFKPTNKAQSIIEQMFADEYTNFLKLASRRSLFNAMVRVDKNIKSFQQEFNSLNSILEDYNTKDDKEE